MGLIEVNGAPVAAQNVRWEDRMRVGVRDGPTATTCSRRRPDSCSGARCIDAGAPPLSVAFRRLAAASRALDWLAVDEDVPPAWTGVAG